MLRELKNRRAFEKAKAKAQDDEMVCGTLAENGEPVYFHMPKDATDKAIREQAFLVRHGRPMSELERQLYDIAARRSADATAD